MAMMGKFAYHVTIRNVASAVYTKICMSMNDHWGTNLNRTFMKFDKSFNCRKKIKINIIYIGHKI